MQINREDACSFRDINHETNAVSSKYNFITNDAFEDRFSNK